MSGLLKFFSDAIGGNLSGAAAFAFIVYIATQVVLAMFQHRADRRAYRYERPSVTGRMRFEKESYHIERLSSALLSLVTETEALCARPGDRLSTADRACWIELYRECVARLGAAAPFINFLSPCDGSPCCGVRDDRAGALRHTIRNSVFAGTNEEQTTKLRKHLAGGRSKSLYLRAAPLVDACRFAVLDNGVSQVGTVLPADMFEGDAAGCSSNAMSKELDLVARYERFADCAVCRLRSSERGRPRFYGKVQAREWRRTIAVVVALVLLAVRAVFSCAPGMCFNVDRLWASSLLFPALALAALAFFLIINERAGGGRWQRRARSEKGVRTI